MDFKYIASNKLTGERTTGFAQAANIPELVVQLKSEGLLPLKVFEAKSNYVGQQTKKMFVKSRVSIKELAVFTRQLAATLSAGLLLTEALETIADDLDNPAFKNIIKNIRTSIQDGANFSGALSRYPKIFSVTYIAIVKSGEATGNLPATMANLAEYLENTNRLREKVKSAVQYPMFVVGFAILVVMVIVLFLIPKFQAMFSQVGAELPLLTRVVVGTSEGILHYFPFIAIATVGLFGIYMYCLRFYKFSYWIDSLKLRIPVLGKEIIHKALVSRFCRTLGFLFAGGVGLAQALDITSQVVNHKGMRESIDQIRSRVISGASLSDEIKKQDIFPNLPSKMTSVGERTGKLSEMLNRTADYYDEELDTSLQNMTSMLEPFLIILIGGIVLVVVLALYLPIFQMSTAVN